MPRVRGIVAAFSALVCGCCVISCKIFFPSHYCSRAQPTITCEAANRALVVREVEEVFSGHCGTTVAIRDGGTFVTPDDCSLQLHVCDGGKCPEVRFAIE